MKYSGPLYQLSGEHMANTVCAMLALVDRKDVKILGADEEVIIRVAVADDQRLFTRGLSGLVNMLPETEVVGVAYDGEERSEEHTSELQSRQYLVCRLLLEKKKKN